jgi:glycosyltransferase involved in cell wall biosynthesis
MPSREPAPETRVRLVIVAHAFPRHAGDVAGSFLGRLAEALVARGHTLAVVAPADRGTAGRFRLGRVDVLQVRYAAPEQEDLAYTGDMARRSRTPSGAWAFLRLVRALRAGARSEARRIGAQLVHAFWWVPGGWAAYVPPLPTVVSLMGTDVTMMGGLAGRLLARRVLARASRVTALSTFLAEETRRLLGRPSLEIERVPVPTDVQRFGRSGASGGKGIVYLGRLSPQKRVDLLLDAVHAAGLRASVTIVGDGPARGDLEARTRALSLDNVRFLGTVPDADVPGLVGAADVAAFPSQREGLGLAAAEALMLGVPVVATSDGGGVLDLLRDGEGSCVAAPTARAFGDALRRCLADPAMRAAAARAGDVLRGQLSPDAVARQFEGVYQRTFTAHGADVPDA